MTQRTAAPEILDEKMDELEALDCVTDLEAVTNPDKAKIIATVRDPLGVEELKSELNDMLMPVWVDIQVA